MSVAACFQAMKDKCTCCLPNKSTELRDQEEDDGKQPEELRTSPPIKGTSSDNLTDTEIIDGGDEASVAAVVPTGEDVDWEIIGQGGVKS